MILHLQCLQVEGEVGVTEEVLLAWLLQEPQTLVWWTTLYRLTAAELGRIPWSWCIFLILQLALSLFSFGNVNAY